ncbi:excinuclease ABC subunit C, partial [bacterium]|nr:excinuclease ABC subunit C [bacterium]
LSAAVEALREVGLKKQPVIGLAKRLEEVFLPGDPLPQNIPRTSSALKLLQTVRDEAHGYAISYHRLLRKKRTLESVLDNIKGVGPSKRRALLNHFGTMTKLREASVETIADVPGFSLKLAQAVFDFLRKASEDEEH